MESIVDMQARDRLALPRLAILAGALALSVVGTARAQDGLVLHLPMDEAASGRVSDRGGGGDGIVQGDVERVSGAIRQALHFDGKGLVVVSDAGRMKIEDEVTVALWAQFPDFRPADFVASLRPSDRAAFNGLFIRTGYDRGWLQVWLHTPDAGRKAGCYLQAGDTNALNFYAVTVKGAKARFYVAGEPCSLYLDGKAREEWDCGIGLREAVHNADLLVIGSDSPTVHARSLKGVIDEFRVYRRALSPAEVKTLFRSYTFNDYPNLVANSSFETATLGDWPDRWTSNRNYYAEDARKDFDIVLDNEVAHSGRRSMRFDVRAVTATRYPFDLRHFFVMEPVLPGQYVISAWMKTDAPGMKIEVGCADGGGWQTFALTDEWQRYWHKMLPFKATYRRFAGFIVAPSKTGRIWVDDVMLARGEEPTPYRPAPKEDAGRRPSSAETTEPPVPSVAVSRAESPPKLDGRLDDACWAAAGQIDAFGAIEGRSYPGHPTRARIAYDDEALYLAFECADPGIAQKPCAAHPRDSDDLWRDDLVEVFIDADSMDETYNQLVFSCGGAQWDCEARFLRETIGTAKFLRELDAGWNGDWQVAVSRSAQGWSAEVVVPWRLFSSQLSRSEAFRLNFTRTVPEADPKYSCWSASPSGFHSPWRFGVLQGFSPDWEACRIWVRRAQFMPYPATNRARLHLDGWQACDRRRAVKTWFRLDGDLDWRSAGETQAEGVCGFNAGADVQMAPAEKMTPCEFRVTEGDRVRSVGRLLVRPPVPLLLSAPSRVLAGQPLRMVLSVGYPPALLRDAVVRWSVTTEGRTVAREEARVVGGDNRFQAVAPPAAGRLAVQAELAAGVGVPLGRMTADVHVLPPDAEVVSLTTEGMRLNGRPFIPFCMYVDRHGIGPYASHGINSVVLSFGKDQVSLSDDGLRDYVESHARQGVKIVADLGHVVTTYLDEQGLNEAELVEKRLAMCGRIVRAVRRHPAIIAWHTVDEPCSHRFLMRTPRHLAMLYDTVRKEDPDRPVLCNVGTMGLRSRYTPVGTTDAVMWDDYTVPVDATRRPLEQALEYLRLGAEWARDTGRPFFNHVGSNYGAYPNMIREQTPIEMRCRVFLNLVKGSRGVFFYHGPPASDASWNGIKAVCEQAASLADAWFQPVRDAEVRADDGRLEHYLGQQDGRWVLVVVNPTHEKRQAALRVSGRAIPGQGAEALFEGGRTVPVEKNGLRDAFGPYDVHVYSLKP